MDHRKAKKKINLVTVTDIEKSSLPTVITFGARGGSPLFGASVPLYFVAIECSGMVPEKKVH